MNAQSSYSWTQSLLDQLTLDLHLDGYDPHLAASRLRLRRLAAISYLKKRLKRKVATLPDQTSTQTTANR